MKKKIINVGIIGHTGRLGKPLAELLTNHPQAKIVYTKNSKKSSGDISKAEIIFLAMPPGKSKQFDYLLKDKQIIDLSIDHRFNTHWFYGLPEIFRCNLFGNKKIANPGCYATASLLSLYPINHLIKNIRIFGVSGVSGRAEIQVDDKKGVELYSSDQKHPQIKEINDFLGQKITGFLAFLDHGLQTGLKVNVSAELVLPRQTKFIDNHFQDWFSNNHFVNKINNKQGASNPIIYLNSQNKNNKEEFEKVKNTNNCNIRYWFNDDSIYIESFIDNLIKGGAGQAVQNFNLMYEFDEEEGLL